MHNRKTKEIWKQKVQAAIRKGKESPVYEPKPVSTQTKAKHLAMIKAILRTAERDWKWQEKAPVIKIPVIKNKRVRWLDPGKLVNSVRCSIVSISRNERGRIQRNSA